MAAGPAVSQVGHQERAGAECEIPAPEAWVRLTVNRLATDRWRRLNGWRAALARTGPPRDADPPSETTVLLTTALRRLPTQHLGARAGARWGAWRG